MVCDRCHRLRWCCQHHIDRRQNSERVVWICSNGYKDILYQDACHDLMDKEIAKMIKEGYYCKMDKTYKKKASKPGKWILKKTINKLTTP